MYITHNSDYRVLVDKNYRLIDSFRYSINRVCAPIIATINSVLAGNNYNLIPNKIFKYGKSTVPNYIGLFLDDYHKDILIKTLFKHIRHINGHKVICEHLTQFYTGNRGSIPQDALKCFERVYAKIDKLVIRKKDKSAVFRVSKVYKKNINSTSIDEIIVNTKDNPHITAYLSPGIKAAESNSYVGCDDSTIVKLIDVSLIVPLTCLWI